MEPWLRSVSYLQSAHHAGSGKHCVVDRIRRDIGIVLVERNFNHNEIIDVLQIITNSLLGVLWMAVTNDQISRGTNNNLIGDMISQN